MGALTQLLRASTTSSLLLFARSTTVRPTGAPTAFICSSSTINRVIHARRAQPMSLLTARHVHSDTDAATIGDRVTTVPQEVTEGAELHFGPYRLSPDQVFYASEHTLGIVNLKPIVPGHVLVIPRRVVPRLAGLHRHEMIDLWGAVHEIGPVIEKHYGGEALTVSMQDGPAAGQTVPHLHVHVLPRRPGDFAKNDQVYDELDKQQLKRALDLDEQRRPRTKEEMAAEALELRRLFAELSKRN